MIPGGSRLLAKIGTLDNPLRIAIFFSGSGTGMNALLNHQNNDQCIHKTVLCVTNKEDAGGIEYAEQHDVPVLVETLDTSLPREERRREHEQRITKQLEEADIDLIVLSGYMRLLSSDFVEKYFPRIINIHPSLLPAFPGKDAHTDVLASGVRVSGCTVHVVDAGMDTGPILAQRRVPVFSTDTRSQLAKRVQVEEHRLYPEVIDSICSGAQFDLGN
ncbi:MAG: phosphoribosylglycinamide formyltransferase [Candidatus Thermoplasmatota archaeon]|nr:phosphoribosylglycinamide formyltransferase [Candidatus Thermoplasmatota archaeon]